MLVVLTLTLSIPFNEANAQIVSEDRKTFSVTSSSVTGTGSSVIARYTTTNTVHTHTYTHFYGNSSRITVRNVTRLDGKPGQPVENSTTSGSIAASVTLPLYGGSVYEVTGTHAVYIGGVYRGGVTTGTWY
ncbi:hypothetical protein ACWE42_15475 [Sutcliffiella cohnii]